MNYVIQNENAHRHDSEVFEISSPPYTFSPEPMQWVRKKQSHLHHGEKIVLTSIY